MRWPVLPVRLAVPALLVAATIGIVGGLVTSASMSGGGGGAKTTSGGSGRAARASPIPVPAGLPAVPVRCPRPTVTVTTAQELTAALLAARPGSAIVVSDGVYVGQFTATQSGTAKQPVFLCGGPGAVLDGGDTSRGYVLHLAPASFWRVVGLTVRNGQKGVVTDGTTGTILQGLTVEMIGDEGIHLRSASSRNVVIGNAVRRTGLLKAKFGEGIYVGSAHSNWDRYSGGGPDRSDANLVQGNHISATGAEAVDIKEGTTGGWVVGNTFDGSGMTGADSWVDVKGNGWLVQDNSGRNTPRDGYQVHHVVSGWGVGNTFRGNAPDNSPAA